MTCMRFFRLSLQHMILSLEETLMLLSTGLRRVVVTKLSFLKAVMTNCDSLMNKRDELLVLVNQYEPKIILLTEILPKM